MSEVLGEAVWAIRGDMEELRENLQEARESVENTTRSVVETLGGIGKKMTVAGGAITGALLGTVMQTTAASDEITKLSRSVDWSVETLSAMRWVASQTGVEMTSLTRGLLNSQKAVYEFVQSGGEADHVLGQLGLTAESFAGLNAEEQFLLLVDALDRIEDPALRSNAVMEIFGRRAGPEMATMLQQGRAGLEQMIQTGAQYTGITQAQGESAEAFQDAVDNLKKSFLPLMQAITDALTGPLQGLVEWMTGAIQGLSQWIAQNQGLVEVMIQVTAVVGGLMAVLGPILMSIGTVISLVTKASAVLGALKAAFAAVTTVVVAVTSPIWGTVAAVAAVVAAVGAAVALLWIYWDEVVAGVEWLWQKVTGFFMWGWEKIKAVFGWIADAASAVAGFLGFGGGDIQMRAEGGPVEAGRPYVVGERGPELFVPQSAGNISPNGGRAGGMGDINININGDMSVRSDQDVQDLSRRLASQIKGELGYAL